MDMNQHFKPQSVKRKLASLKAFCHYLETEDILPENPFRKLTIGIREPQQLPRTIPLRIIEAMLSASYQRLHNSIGMQRVWALRDTAVMELLLPVDTSVGGRGNRRRRNCWQPFDPVRRDVSHPDCRGVGGEPLSISPLVNFRTLKNIRYAASAFGKPGRVPFCSLLHTGKGGHEDESV